MKIVQKIKFEWVWCELESKKCFQRQSVKKYLKLTLVLIVHYGKSLIAIFQDFFTSINKTFIFAGRMGARLSFYKV